jgi:hypothetical protein
VLRISNFNAAEIANRIRVFEAIRGTLRPGLRPEEEAALRQPKILVDMLRNYVLNFVQDYFVHILVISG